MPSLAKLKQHSGLGLLIHTRLVLNQSYLEELNADMAYSMPAATEAQQKWYEHLGIERESIISNIKRLKEIETLMESTPGTIQVSKRVKGTTKQEGLPDTAVEHQDMPSSYAIADLPLSTPAGASPSTPSGTSSSASTGSARSIVRDSKRQKGATKKKEPTNTTNKREDVPLHDAVTELLLSDFSGQSSFIPTGTSSSNTSIVNSTTDTVDLTTDVKPVAVPSNQPHDGKNGYILYCFGTVKVTSGAAGAAWSIFREDGKDKKISFGYGYKYMGFGRTTGEAEYVALLSGLTMIPQDCNHLTIRGDSKMLINQVKGVWECLLPKLLPLNITVKALIQHNSQQRPVTLELITRAQNNFVVDLVDTACVMKRDKTRCYLDTEPNSSEINNS